MGGGQEDDLDACGLPWTIDPDVGVVIAPVPTRPGIDVGDGAFVYRFVPSSPGGGGVVHRVPTTTVEKRAQVLEDAARRHAEHVRALGAANHAYDTMVAERRSHEREEAEKEKKKKKTPDRDDDDDDDSQEEEDHEALPADSSAERKGKNVVKQKPKKPKTAHPRPSDVPPTWDATAPDAELEALLRVDRLPRPGGKGVDFAVYTPDGRRFRSKASALRYMRGDE